MTAPQVAQNARVHAALPGRFDEVSGGDNIYGAPDCRIRPLSLGTVEDDAAPVDHGGNGLRIGEIPKHDFDGKAGQRRRAHDPPHDDTNLGSTFEDEPLDQSSSEKTRGAGHEHTRAGEAV